MFGTNNTFARCSSSFVILLTTLTVFSPTANAQFGLGILPGSDSGGSWNTSQGSNWQQVMPSSSYSSGSNYYGQGNNQLGTIVGQAVVSSAIDAIQGNMHVQNPPGMPGVPYEDHWHSTQPIAGPVVVVGAPNNSGQVCTSPSSTPVIIAQTPVPASSTVVNQSVTSAATPNTTPDLDRLRNLITQAKNSFRQARYSETVQQLDQALELAPENSDVLQFRAFAAFADGKFEAAAADVYDALLSGNTWDWQAVYELYQSKELYEKQLRVLEKTRRQAPNMSTHFLLAYQYIVLHHLENGKKELNAALNFQPDEPVLTSLVAAIDQRLAQP
ncbi:MAG: hypothetical protein KDB03_26020 [Planctomycetales bacterium]|nr:hypothetical protein [Planctomycetales bacterium]